jgi:hypothetical protein
MPGQWWDELPRGAGRLLGADVAELWLGAPAVLVPDVDVVPLAALAIAAPPPTRAPVTANGTITAFRRRIWFHLLCSRLPTTIHSVRLSGVGVT